VDAGASTTNTHSALCSRVRTKNPFLSILLHFFFFDDEMVKGNKQTTNTVMEIREMRALIERMFGELNASVNDQNPHIDSKEDEETRKKKMKEDEETRKKKMKE